MKVTDPELQGIANRLCVDGEHFAELLAALRSVRDDTARACVEMADIIMNSSTIQHGDDRCAEQMIIDAIRAHFNLSRPPSMGGEGGGK
jgi:hypothetical protein